MEGSPAVKGSRQMLHESSKTSPSAARTEDESPKPTGCSAAEEGERRLSMEAPHCPSPPRCTIAGEDDWTGQERQKRKRTMWNNREEAKNPEKNCRGRPRHRGIEEGGRRGEKSVEWVGRESTQKIPSYAV